MTKNLEDIKKEGREEFRKLIFSSSWKNNDEWLDRFADTLLDACEGAVVPEKREEFLDGTREQFTRRAGSVGWNDCREETLKNFSTFRTGGEKDSLKDPQG